MGAMPTKRSALPTGVFTAGRWYYRVRAEGKKRVWIKLSPIADGLPAMYTALAQLLAEAIEDDRMPAVIAAWQRDVMPAHAPKTQTDERAMCKVIAEAFIEFRASEVQAPDVATFLQPYQAKRTMRNHYRAMLRELMRYSIERGWRIDNPVDHIRTLPTPPRTRYITDSELRRIKVGGIYGDDGKRTRSGLMLAGLVDVAYLTGQRIGDLLELRWTPDPDDPDAPHVAADGLHFRPGKTRRSTRAAVVIGWTTRLQAAIDGLRKLQAARLLKRRAEQRVVSGYVFTTQGGLQTTYSGIASAWQRAKARAGVADAHIHDIRAKALTDKERSEGMQAARTMGTHSTEGQTADYLRSRSAKRTGATR